MESFIQFDILLVCSSEEEWSIRVRELGKELGFEHIQVSLLPGHRSALEQTFVCSTYPEKWGEIYDGRKLAHIDPTIQHCLRHSTPLVWGSEIFTGKQQQAFYRQACSFGLHSGITLPFHGVNGELGILCVNHVKQSREMADRGKLSELSLMRDYVFESFRKLSSQEICETEIPAITPRELECLKWCAEGKSSWDIAHILKCSEAVVNFHFGNLRRKFNTTSRRQVVVRAIQMGIIYPPL